MAAFAVSGAGAQQPSGKVLVAYFSHSGNTREVARQISEATGGDLFEIVPATPYPTEYRAVVDQGKKEIEAGVRPALKNPVGDLSQYDVIFVGSPCWWAPHPCGQKNAHFTPCTVCGILVANYSKL